MADHPLRPPYDPQLAVALAAFPKGDITPESIPQLVEIQKQAGTLEGALAAVPGFTHEERTAHSKHGPVPLSIFRLQRSKSTTPAPCIYFTHSGGFICGTRWTMIADPLRYAQAAGAILISVEYRLAPEHVFPAAVDDAWAGLQWVASHASELGIDPTRLMVAGTSAGANLAVGLASLARDKGGPSLCGMLLDCAMLDDRQATPAINQYTDGSWTKGSNLTAWRTYLGGDKQGQQDVSIVAAPNRARAEDLRGLPTAFLCVGTAEGFRDEVVQFAMKLWEAGVQAELHAWPGGFHCFDLMIGDAAVSKQSVEARKQWVKKILTVPGASL
jgi:acetyl esterase/lipase